MSVVPAMEVIEQGCWLVDQSVSTHVHTKEHVKIFTSAGPGTRTGGGEDLDVFFRVIMGGYRLVYEPASLLYHLHRRDYAHLRKQIYSYGVGFTAYLTKCLLDDPRLVFDFIG